MKLRKPPPPLPYETINDVSVAETEKRPFRLQFYTVISILVVTLGLIAVVVYLNKKLPDASHSRYDLPGVSRADISFAGDRETGQQEKAIRNAIVVVEEDVLARAAKAFRKRQIRFPPNGTITSTSTTETTLTPASLSSTTTPEGTRQIPTPSSTTTSLDVSSTTTTPQSISPTTQPPPPRPTTTSPYVSTTTTPSSTQTTIVPAIITTSVTSPSGTPTSTPLNVVTDTSISSGSGPSIPTTSDFSSTLINSPNVSTEKTTSPTKSISPINAPASTQDSTTLSSDPFTVPSNSASSAITSTVPTSSVSAQVPPPTSTASFSSVSLSIGTPSSIQTTGLQTTVASVPASTSPPVTGTPLGSTFSSRPSTTEPTLLPSTFSRSEILSSPKPETSATNTPSVTVPSVGSSSSEAISTDASVSETVTSSGSTTASESTAETSVETISMVLPTATETRPEGTPPSRVPDEKVKKAGEETVSVSNAIVANFVPIIVARAFVAVLNGLYSQIASVEPLRQLLSDAGASGPALAGSAINLAPIAVSFLLADFGSAVAVEALSADGFWCSKPVLPDNLMPCVPRISVNRWATSVILSGLVVVSAALVSVVALWFKTPSRIAVETTSISGVAMIMGHPQIEDDFRTIPTEMTNGQLALHLRDKRYTVGTFEAVNGIKYGMMPFDPSEDRHPSLLQRLERTAVEKRALFSLASWQRTRFKVDAVFAVFHLALLGLAIAALANVDHPRRIFTYTTRGRATAARVGICLIGIVVSRYWGMLFRDAQNLAPYARMHARPSPAQGTILKRGVGMPFFAIVPLARTGYAIPACVAVTAFVAEFFVVAVSGMPWRPGQLRGEYICCGAMCVVVLMVMLSIQGLVLYWRTTLPALPRRPDSVAAVMTYVAGTAMGREFHSVSGIGRKAADEVITEMGRRYAYGWRAEEGGARRWVVDEVGMGYEGDGRTRVF